MMGSNSLVIRIKHKTLPEWLIYMIVLLLLFFPAMTEIFHVPLFIRYVLDLFWITLLLFLLKNSKKGSNRYTKLFITWIFLFFMFVCVSYIINFQSISYFLWGLRNNFRFYVFFLAIVVYMKEKNVEDLLSTIDVLFWINTVVVFFQYFVLQIKQDYLGGLFGTKQGCNGYLNIFLMVILANSILNYLNKKEKLSICLTKGGLTLLIAALAELKVYYFEAILIIALAILITDFSWRKLFIIIVAVIGIGMSISFLLWLYPGFQDVYTAEGLIEHSRSQGGYTGSGDLNRLSAVQILSERYLVTPLERWIGLGLGNCDYATYDFLITPFFIEYSWLHYMWFSIAFVFLEMGYIGLVFYFGFFGLVLFTAKKINNGIYSQLAIILSLCFILNVVYNAALRTEAGYLAYFMLALPFISSES